MSVLSQTEQTPKFTSMEEMKRWQVEREDRLHAEHVRERILQRAVECEKQELADHDRWVTECERQQRDKAKPTIKSPKSQSRPRREAGGS